MSNIEEFPVGARRLTEYDALVAAAPSAIDAIPGAVYVCDHEGWLVCYNSEAAELWGRRPALAKARERFCGSHRLFLLDGTELARYAPYPFEEGKDPIKFQEVKRLDLSDFLRNNET